MAWSNTFLSSQEISDKAANRPILLAKNALTTTGGSLEWNKNTGVFSETEYPDPLYPSNRALDGYAHLPAKPLQAAVNVWYLLMRADTSIAFDSMVILGHNFGDCAAAGVNVSLQIADDAAFSSNLETLTASNVTTNRRHVALSLDHDGSVSLADITITQKRYTGVAYVRLRLASVNFSNFSSAPQIGEVILAKRWQLYQKPDEPWDDLQFRSSVSDAESKSGVITRYVRHAGRRVLSAGFTFATETHAAQLRNAYIEAAYGTKPIVWIDNPASTYPTQAALYGYLQPDLSIPYQGPYERTAQVEFTEVAPFYWTEE